MSNLYGESERIGMLESRIFALKDEIERMKSEWIDPQRLVDLAKRYTDETGHGWAGIQFSDVAEGWDNWTANTPEGNPGSKTANDALKAAES